MSNAASIAIASSLIWDNWQAGTVLTELPLAYRPQNRADGYAIQSMLAVKAEKGLIGWKIAATSAAGQHHIGVDGPLAGRLIGERTFATGVTLSLAANRMRVAEPEFAFRVGRALSPRRAPYDVDDVLAAMDALIPSLEVPDSRFSDFAKAGTAQLIADNACAHEFVLGTPTAADWRAIDLAAHPVRAELNGTGTRRVLRDGIGSNVLGDPRVALTWLVNELSSLGVTLTAGQIVTTGSCMQPLAIEPGDAVYADFGVLGSISARFT